MSNNDNTINPINMFNSISPINCKFKKGDIVYCYQSEFKNFGKFKIEFIKITENGRRIFYCKRIDKQKNINYIETFFGEDMCYPKDLPFDIGNRLVKVSRFD